MAVQTRLLIPPWLILLLLLGSSCDRSPSPASVSGTIETDEARVASRYGGRVERVFVQEGEALTPGQLIAELDAAELRARREQVAAQLAEAEAGPRREEIAAAQADWEALVAQLKLARLERQRADELFAAQTLPATERDRAASSEQALEKSAAAARARYDLLLAGTRPERLAQVRGQVAELDAQLQEMQVRVPTNGVLEVLHVKVGDVLAPNQPIATLLFTNRLWVRGFVPAPWLGHLKLGDSVTVRVDSFPGRDFSGTVEQIARGAEFTPRNVQTVEERVKQVFGVKVRLDDASGALRAGMAADLFFAGVPR